MVIILLLSNINSHIHASGIITTALYLTSNSLQYLECLWSMIEVKEDNVAILNNDLVTISTNDKLSTYGHLYELLSIYIAKRENIPQTE